MKEPKPILERVSYDRELDVFIRTVWYDNGNYTIDDWEPPDDEG